MTDNFLIERDGPIATLIINRAKVRNAFSLSMWQALPDLMRALDDDPAVRVIVIRGAGEKAFAAGADISEFEATMTTPEGAMEQNDAYEAALASVERTSKPVIAMIYGYAMGGGCGLTTACDLRIAADTVQNGDPSRKARRRLQRDRDPPAPQFDRLGQDQGASRVGPSGGCR